MMTLTEFSRRLRGPARPSAAKVKAFAGQLLEGAAQMERHGVRYMEEQRLLHRIERVAAEQLQKHARRLKESRRGKRVTRNLRECINPCGTDMDVAGASIIKSVRVLGFDSVNGRRYTEEAVRGAIGMYEGAKVNLDHPSLTNPSAPRSVRDRFGLLVNVAMDSEGLVADLKFNPAHPFAGTVRWFAENAPEALGLSHNAIGLTRQGEDGEVIVERIVSVRSVDLVADPATVRGLR